MDGCLYLRTSVKLHVLLLYTLLGLWIEVLRCLPRYGPGLPVCLLQYGGWVGLLDLRLIDIDTNLFAELSIVVGLGLVGGCRLLLAPTYIRATAESGPSRRKAGNIT